MPSLSPTKLEDYAVVSICLLIYSFIRSFVCKINKTKLRTDCNKTLMVSSYAADSEMIQFYAPTPLGRGPPNKEVKFSVDSLTWSIIIGNIRLHI